MIVGEEVKWVAARQAKHRLSDLVRFGREKLRTR